LLLAAREFVSFKRVAADRVPGGTDIWATW
jgi:hypothetical protein